MIVRVAFCGRFIIGAFELTTIVVIIGDVLGSIVKIAGIAAIARQKVDRGELITLVPGVTEAVQERPVARIIWAPSKWASDLIRPARSKSN